MNGAVGEEQRRRQIIGHPLGPELPEYREVHGATRVGEPAAECSAGRVNACDRGFPELRRVEQPEPSFRNFDVGAWPPYKSAANILRMNGFYKHGDPPQRNAASDEPLAQLGQHCLRLRRRPRPVNKPVDYRSDFRVGHRGYLIVSMSWLILQAGAFPE